MVASAVAVLVLVHRERVDATLVGDDPMYIHKVILCGLGYCTMDQEQRRERERGKILSEKMCLTTEKTQRQNRRDAIVDAAELVLFGLLRCLGSDRERRRRRRRGAAHSRGSSVSELEEKIIYVHRYKVYV